MTIRDWVEVAMRDEGDQAGWLGLVAAMQILRSVVQQESATAEGCCVSIVAWTEIYGAPVTETKVRQWMDDWKRIFELEIPDATVAMAISGD